MHDQLPYLLAFLGTGLLLGLRHAMDADHIAAMSTIVVRTGNIGQSLRNGAIWGTGHTATLFLAGSVVLLFRLTIPEALIAFLEVLVGMMLVWLGVSLLINFNGKAKPHAAPERSGARSVFVGAVHGLAGSGTLMLLILATADSVTLGLAYILVFGAGSIAGMLGFSGVIAVPLAWSASSTKLQRWIGIAAGLASALVGIYLIIENAI
jgi:hypothetical protein